MHGYLLHPVPIFSVHQRTVSLKTGIVFLVQEEEEARNKPRDTIDAMRGKKETFLLSFRFFEE